MVLEDVIWSPTICNEFWVVKKKTGDGVSHLGKDRMDDLEQSWTRNLDVNIGHCAIVYLLGLPYLLGIE